MSVHQRSPLCVDYQDYYKPLVSKFKREIDQKVVSKDNAESTQYTALSAVVHEARRQEEMKQREEKEPVEEESGSTDSDIEDSDMEANLKRQLEK